MVRGSGPKSLWWCLSMHCEMTRLMVMMDCLETPRNLMVLLLPRNYPSLRCVRSWEPRDIPGTVHADLHEVPRCPSSLPNAGDRLSRWSQRPSLLRKLASLV